MPGENGKCHIIAAGTYYGEAIAPAEGDLVIAADGGLALCHKLGLPVQIVVGDFDSLGYVPEGENVVALPKAKDDTDTLYALRLGLERGYRAFHIHGGTGGARLDHTVANMQCLCWLARRGAQGWLYDQGAVFTAIDGPATLTIEADYEGIVSVFALDGAAEGVTIRGLEFEVSDATLTPDFPIGCSNALKGQKAEISVKSGCLLISLPAVRGR
ncbi:MAG: thiamine diphosphokinase [Clostridia bacterium]|nr:thiamine diphosphokinase [Clostridia bacterium]